MTATRWHALSGAVGAALVFTALFLPGPPPKANDAATVLTADLVQHRTALVAGMLLAGTGFMALVWFIGVLGGALRRHEDPGAPLSLAAVAGGVVGVILLLVGMLVFSGVTFRAASMGNAAVVRAAVDSGNMLIEASKYGFAVLILATCAAKGLVSPRFAAAGVVSAAILVLSTFPPFLVDHGVGQFGGGIDVLGGMSGFVWIVALSVNMARPSVALA
jgi:hypothetical protein